MRCRMCDDPNYAPPVNRVHYEIGLTDGGGLRPMGAGSRSCANYELRLAEDEIKRLRAELKALRR